MRTRGSRKNADSMDLLLDTICNTFGGVLFIALLVVMLVQQSPESQRTNATVDPAVTSKRQAGLAAELSGLADEIQRLEAARSGQERTLSALAPESVRQLLAERDARKTLFSRLVTRQSRLETLLAAMRTGLSTARNSVALTQTQHEKLEVEAAKLKAELDREKLSRTHELRTPIAKKSPSKQQIGFVLQYGRLYLWHDYDARGVRRGLNLEDFLVIGRTSEGLQTTPRPTRGVAVTASTASKDKLTAVLRRFSPAEQYPVFLVRPDSFDEFAIVRDAASDLGFEYRLLPLDAAATIVDRGGTAGVVQ